MIIQTFPLQYQGQRRIGIAPMGYDKAFPAMMKQIPGSRWTPEEKCWHIPYEKTAYATLKRIFGEAQILTRTDTSTPALSQKTTPSPPTTLTYQAEVTRMQQKLMLQRYSPNTIKTYLSFFRLLLSFYPDKDPESLQKEDLMRFFLDGIKQRKWSDSTQNQAVNAVKYYYEKVLGQERTFYELRPRRSRKLPGVFSEEEIIKLFRVIPNLKHRCILMLIYSAGLRIGESINLRRQDVQIDRKQVFIKAGKGKTCAELVEVKIGILSCQIRSFDCSKPICRNMILFIGSFKGRMGDSILPGVSKKSSEEQWKKRGSIHSLRFIPYGTLSQLIYWSGGWI